MNRKYNIQLNLSPYANYFLDGGDTGGMAYIPEENGFVRGSFSTNWTPQGISPNDAVLSKYQQSIVNSAERRQDRHEAAQNFLNSMNNSGGGGWAAAIAPAATNAVNALTDTEASTAERVATAMGIPALAKIWTADNTAGDANLKAMQSNIDTFARQNLIQDASSTFGANNAVKLNNKFIAPVPMTGVKDLSWKDFRGNMFKKGAAATLQGAAAGSVGGPWGALGGAVTGLFGSLFGGIGARSRAKKAYAEYQNKMATLTSQANSMYKQVLTNQTLSNMQALANGNMSQKINDMANIRAYGGNLFDGGGNLTDEQQMVLADIQADPRILFTPKYSQWRDYIRRTSPDYLDRLYTSLPYEQQQDIYQNDREAWGALSNEAKGNFGGAQVRKKTDEVSPYVAGALGLVGAAPAWEAITMFPMLENGLNAYFGYEGAKNLPTAVTDAYDYAKKGDWSRAGLSAGEAVLDGMFIGNGIKGAKNLSELSGLSDRVYNAFPLLDPYTTSGATFGYHGASALDRLLGTVSRRNGFTYKPEIPEFHRRLRINEPNDMRFDENGNFILSSGRTGEGHDGIVNFATSEPARGHKSHKTLSGIDDYIVNPEALKNQKFISIEPSDTFFETGELAINPKDITLVSGNPKLLDYAKNKGFNTLSSPKLREYYKKNYAESTTSGKNSNKLNITKEGANVSPRDVGDEIQRLTSRRGAPTLEDYRFFENETGLPSGVVPIEEYNTIGQQALYGHSPSLRANLNWNNVAYDPATQVESLYRKAKINPDDIEAVKKYNEYIDNLKRISNNTEYAMGGNLYTDLSPNMMSLWSNKQQIDQQKVMNQQFSLGLGNTAFTNQFAGGGQMTSADVPDNMQYYANGGTHEENPYGGIQVGTDQQGTPNLAEEGEFRWNDFVFSDRINVDADLLQSFNLMPTTKHQNKKAAKGKLSYADMAKKYAKRNKELENDPITKNSMEAFMQRLANAQEYQKKAEQLEAQKQNELQDYKTALNKQNNNPMYGTMKYNGMGNAATQQGVNSGVDAGMGNPMSNADLSNVNRSGNEMMAAYGGNLFAIGGDNGFPESLLSEAYKRYRESQYPTIKDNEVTLKAKPQDFTSWVSEPDTYPVDYEYFFDNNSPTKFTGMSPTGVQPYIHPGASPIDTYQYTPYKSRIGSNLPVYAPHSNYAYESNGSRIPFYLRYEPQYFKHSNRIEDNYIPIEQPWKGNVVIPDRGLQGNRNWTKDEGSPAYWDVVRAQIDWNPYKGGKPEDIIYSNINSAGQFSDPEAYSKISPNNLPIIPGITPEETRENYEKYLNSLDIKGRQQLLVNHGYDLGTTGDNGDGVDGDWGNKSKAAWDDFNLKRQDEYNTAYNTSVNNFRQQTGWTDNNLNLGVRVGDATTNAANNGDGQSSIGYNTATNTGKQDLTGNLGISNKVIGKTTPNTNPDAAVPSDPKEVPLYSTAGKYAQFGKGIMPIVWDWANKTNVAYDPYQRDADRLEALANEGPALRTADTIGGYRAPDLMDVERLNNSARSEGLAQMQAILDAANGNRGYVGAHSAQNNYNTQMGIGDNYVKTQEANNTNRLQTDQFNHGINVANQNAINTMRQDNQRAEQTQHQAALSGIAQAAALRQRENLHADEVNTERMKNRAANQAAAVDNALNYFTTQAMENQELNTRNNDPTNPYWIDKYGRTHYTGDSGLTQAIRNAFGNDKYGRNGTFTGERLTEWNNLTKKYKAKDLKEHPELWRHLVAQQREANKIDAEKAEQARTEELEALRGTYQSNLARLNALRDSGAIISDPSYNLYTGWADEDYSGNQGLLRTRNQALDQYITQIGNNYDRYLYEKQLAQNQAKALGGYLNAGQNNNNDYYSYTRI